ncbi:hypothetical protein PIB30_080718 [Stylosanthes scabra]|uniref:Uncharacterized protein n=1 Tax=Stylosanthes scabra TaxID=79078 RepID=A0ABU6ZQB5_9FABA|nr:hypothetical protein [Stylosanthes scabra]
MLARPHAKKSKEMIAPACAYFHANARTMRPRGALVRPCGGIGCSRPKLLLHLASPYILNAPSSSVRLHASGRTPARSHLLHLKEYFQTLFLITISQHHSSHNSWNPTHFPTPMNFVNITHYSLTNGNDNGADSDDEHTKD